MNPRTEKKIQADVSNLMRNSRKKKNFAANCLFALADIIGYSQLTDCMLTCNIHARIDVAFFTVVSCCNVHLLPTTETRNFVLNVGSDAKNERWWMSCATKCSTIVYMIHTMQFDWICSRQNSCVTEWILVSFHAGEFNCDTAVKQKRYFKTYRSRRTLRANWMYPNITT